MKEPKTGKIVQSNDLVRAFPALDNEMRLSLVQKRILFHLITEAREQESHELGSNWVRVEMDTMTKEVMPSKGGRDSSEVWNALDDFRDKRYNLRLQYQDKKGKLRVRDTSWITAIDRPITASGYLDVRMEELIVEHVREQVSLFTMLDMPTARKLKSYAQVKLWELLTSFSSLGRWEVSLEELKRLLEIDPNSYKHFPMFRKGVLEKSCEAINKETKLKVSFDIVREGRKPVGVLFTIGQKVREKQVEKTGYSKELEAELKKRGVQHLSKYHKEGLTEEHWREALAQDISEGKLVAEARKLRDKVKGEQEKAQAKQSAEERLADNKTWWEEHRGEFPESWWSDEKTVFTPKGINFVWEDFREQLRSRVRQ